jgi:hypothetical protein
MDIEKLETGTRAYRGLKCAEIDTVEVFACSLQSSYCASGTLVRNLSTR